LKDTAYNLAVEINIYKPYGWHAAEILYSPTYKGWYVSYLREDETFWGVMNEEYDELLFYIKILKEKAVSKIH